MVVSQELLIVLDSWECAFMVDCGVKRPCQCLYQKYQVEQSVKALCAGN